MELMHENSYDIGKAMCSLVAAGGPVLCRDEMEDWSSSEANLFEEALEKYGKDFVDIRQDFLPWKSLKSVIEYYYMWKTTDRYVQQVHPPPVCDTHSRYTRRLCVICASGAPTACV